MGFLLLLLFLLTGISRAAREKENKHVKKNRFRAARKNLSLLLYSCFQMSHNNYFFWKIGSNKFVCIFLSPRFSWNEWEIGKRAKRGGGRGEAEVRGRKSVSPPPPPPLPSHPLPPHPRGGGVNIAEEEEKGKKNRTYLFSQENRSGKKQICKSWVKRLPNSRAWSCERCERGGRKTWVRLFSKIALAPHIVFANRKRKIAHHLVWTLRVRLLFFPLANKGV